MFFAPDCSVDSAEQGAGGYGGQQQLFAFEDGEGAFDYLAGAGRGDSVFRQMEFGYAAVGLFGGEYADVGVFERGVHGVFGGVHVVCREAAAGDGEVQDLDGGVYDGFPRQKDARLSFDVSDVVSARG